MRPRRARHEIAEHLNGELGSERTQDAVLLVGELVTNSVLHADSGETHEIVLELIIGLDAVRVVVTDGGSSTVPMIQPLDSSAPRWPRSLPRRQPERPLGHGARGHP